MSLSRILNNEDPSPFPSHVDESASASRGSPTALHPVSLSEPPLQPYPQRSSSFGFMSEWAGKDARPEGDSDYPVLRVSRNSTLSNIISGSLPKHYTQYPPQNGSHSPKVQSRPSHYRTATGEMPPRPGSSDLEGCEDIWDEELKDYISATHHREKEVEQWFEMNAVKRNQEVARDRSHQYATKLSKLPSNYFLQRSPSPASSYGYADNAPYMPPEPGPVRGRERDLDDNSHFNSSRDLPPTSVAPTRVVYCAREGQGDTEQQALAPSKRGRPAKKRKVVDETLAIPDDEPAGSAMDMRPDWDTPSLFHPPPPLPMPPPAPIAAALASASNGHPQPLPPPPVPEKPARKKPGPKKKRFLGQRLPRLPPSAPFYFELGEEVPPLKKAKKVDDGVMVKRIKTLEESQRKVWTSIARRDVAKVYKFHILGFNARATQADRIAKVASVQARKPFAKTNKTAKDTQTKAKRLMREMQVFWKKNEREERDVRKREHKEAMDRLKAEEEKREATRQARKLEFLISQTELYSHFVGNKLKTAQVEGDEESTDVPAGAELVDVDASALQDINFDDDDQTNLRLHARHNAQEAIALAKQRAQQFDAQAALDRKTNEALKLAKGQAHIHDSQDEGQSSAPLVDLDSDELNFQNPTSLSGPLTIGQPKMLMAQLKEYQLKGLNWLATLYEQGINGILADEMGLGKTVQSISLLSKKSLASFLGSKRSPTGGNVKDRTTLRKFWSKKEITYNKDAPFHVLITSYQLVTQDQQYFQRVNWQYMILDEAQNIKNSSSVRWKTLLGFHCRNRLLLTGTPIQNSMQELWALLHFIMPSLFDSHDEFNEWFSKDIENAAENKGSKLNEHQLRRLHMILKPFMLRRVKRHVQNELSEKIEKDIYVDLSARQRALYKALLANVSVADLLEKAANIGDADSARSLMNLVMQFRKVCNHPELFERADVVAPFSFCQFGRPGPLIREGDFVHLPYSTRNPIGFAVPELLHREGLLYVPSEDSRNVEHSGCLNSLLNIWTTDWIHRSLYEEGKSDHVTQHQSTNHEPAASSFSFLRFLGSSEQEAHDLHLTPLISRRLKATHQDSISASDSAYSSDSEFAASAPVSAYRIPATSAHLQCLERADGLPDVLSISKAAWTTSCLSRPSLRWFVPAAVAPPIALYSNDRAFLESEAQVAEAPLESLALFGLPPELRESTLAVDRYQTLMSGLPPSGLIGSSPPDQLPLSKMQVPEAKRLIYDSAKLARLDLLLQELKSGDHRVLVYFQMTRMMDLMEEYLIYRQYKYLRLDGSSKLEDRRDMVIDWQTKPDIFVFLLSTRAGGLGINLTAADTVVFYDHDWNPSNDAQAMDRAHRLGQTRQVTVYRLITRGTIDERIVQMARVKKDVQDIVVGNKTFTDVAKPSEIMQLLLNDEQLANLDASAAPSTAKPNMQASGGEARDLWNEEDDFFGQSGSGAATAAGTEFGEDDNGGAGAAATSTRGKKRKAGGGTRGRGRKKSGVARDGL
ncbi:SNF2 family helicase ATPase [Mycena chlorophos]|uniref:Chromatin-remodeling ATPase INO80 n=1 Tax=Mycena chlorophos TaxID=658473 RepID=A0A8H6T606_MYCCL|nr:SNF2 family helicase ATPase [Mycena chlorophos]